jgi:hypothetical protein
MVSSRRQKGSPPWRRACFAERGFDAVTAKTRFAGRRSGWRTPLRVAADWPGYFPTGPAVVRLLIDAGADPSAPSADGPSETPLHGS